MIIRRSLDDRDILAKRSTAHILDVRGIRSVVFRQVGSRDILLGINHSLSRELEFLTFEYLGEVYVEKVSEQTCLSQTSQYSDNVNTSFGPIPVDPIGNV